MQVQSKLHGRNSTGCREVHTSSCLMKPSSMSGAASSHPVSWNIPSITKYRHFPFTAKKPGVVYLQELADQEVVAFQMLRQPKLTFPDHVLPDPSINKGMALDRQWYLYEKVHPYCTEETADQVCPQPKELKPAAGTHQPVFSD